MKRTAYTILAALLVTTLTIGTASAGWPEGVAAFKKGDLSAAEAEFKAITEAQPEWHGAHFMLGWTYLKKGSAKAAVPHLRKAYDLKPDDASIQLRLGEAYVQTGRHSDAVGFLSKINSASLPKDAQAYLAQLKAVALTKSGQADRAVEEIAKAANANPNDADLWFQYGQTAYSTGDTNAAIRALGKAVQLNSSNLEMQRVYAQALVSQARRTSGSSKIEQYRAAASAAQRVVAGNPSFKNLMLLGGAQLGAKQYDGAVSSFQKASAKNTGDWLPDYHLGQAYTSKGQYGSAESALRTALNRAQSPSDQNTVWKQLGFVFEKQKNFSEAIAAYQRAGDGGSAARVAENQKTLQYNESVAKENQEIERLRNEQERIKEELKNLPGARPPKF